MNYHIIIDADSLLYKAVWREPDNLEKAYLEFCGDVAKSKSAVFQQVEYKPKDTVSYELVFTKGSNFRYSIYPDYKASRGDKLAGVDELFELIQSRLEIVIPEEVEADDYVIAKAKVTGDFIACIDKDIIKASPVPCYNFNKNEWTSANRVEDVEQWYLYQAMMGDSTDNIKGAKGVGKVGAQKVLNQLLGSDLGWEHFTSQFESEEKAIQSIRLVRMDQWDYNTKTLKLWEPSQFCKIKLGYIAEEEI